MVDRRPGRQSNSGTNRTVVGSVEKIPYIALQRINEKMTDSQKEGIKVWNAMVNKLREAGLMEEKQ